jgi:Winged helix-turn helix/DDE superfamily endonuclease
LTLTAAPFEVSDDLRMLLERWARARGTPPRVAMRARIVLLASQGASNAAIARELGVSRPTVIMWRERFQAGGARALCEVKPGRGRKRTISSAKVQEILRATTQSSPPGEAQWSCRSMAKAQGVSPATVARIWDAHGVKPHRVRASTPSNDPKFTGKLTDVVGLYLNPLEKALALCLDENSKIQALARTQPGFSMRAASAETLTAHRDRNGTMTLLAAMNALEGSVVGHCLPRHRSNEFLKFLRLLDREFPDEMDVHLFVDQYRTDRQAGVSLWLEKHPRFHVHFTPARSSWLELVGHLLCDLTDKAIRRHVLHSVPDLAAAIHRYLGANTEDTRPFVWTASLDAVLEKVSGPAAVAGHGPA